MKANQKFMEADEAVSPVIGVILMVAITVVLAAVVFVLVSDLGGGSGESQPAISWSVSQANKEASVTSADPGAQWEEFEVRFSFPGTITGDAAATATTTTDFFPLTGGAIGGGDTLTFACTPDAVPLNGDLTVTLRHIDSNSVSREFTFTNMENCA